MEKGPDKESYSVLTCHGAAYRAVKSWEKWPTLARVAFNGNKAYAACKTITLHLGDNPRLCWLQINYHHRQAPAYRYAKNMDMLGFPTWIEKC